MNGFLGRINVKSIDDAEMRWKADQAKIANLRSDLERIQQEVLATVDRLAPQFDEKIQSLFINLNRKIGTLVKDKTMAQFAIDNPLENWDSGVLWPGTVSATIRTKKAADKKTVKLLLRQAVWKFLSDCLFDRAQPFAPFGGTLARELGSIYATMFPDFGK